MPSQFSAGKKKKFFFLGNFLATLVFMIEKHFNPFSAGPVFGQVQKFFLENL